MLEKIQTSQKSGKKISLIIPAYKAEKFIKENLLKIKEVLDHTRYRYEIICVVDGMQDKTYEAAKSIEKKYPDIIKVEGYLTNLGKGHAVRYGMAKAKGDIIGFVDAGLDINPNGIGMLMEHFEWYGADIIVGSKRHPASKVDYPWQRRIISTGYQIIVKILFNLKIKDTQTGIKFFKRNVVEEVLPRLLIKAFAFDIEMLSVANYLGFKRIFEAPVELEMEFKGGISTIASKGFIRTSISTLWDTLAVFYRLRILRYYDSKNENNWVTPKYLTLKQKK